MGIEIHRRIDELGEALSLAPERHDPRRRLAASGRPRLDSLLTLASDSVTPAAARRGPPLVVLDTSHAYEGFVLLQPASVLAQRLGSSKRRVQPGDVLVSRLRPYLRQVAYVDAGLFSLLPDGNAVVVSSEFFVLRDTPLCPAAGLLPFLLSAPVQTILAAGQEGGHHPRFPRELLASLPVPAAVLAAAPRLAVEVRSLAAAIRSALRQGQQLVSEVEELLEP